MIHPKQDSESLRLKDVTDTGELSAGRFFPWLNHSRDALAVQGETDVPCGQCNACCRSSYFIHIGPTETDTLARIPRELLFDAPGGPDGGSDGPSDGLKVLGYDSAGCCPMLIEGACSIYEVRPQTCRNYDCRVFSAAGITEEENEKPLVASQTLRWKFDYRDEKDTSAQAAVLAAARFVRDHGESLFSGSRPSSTELALVSLKVYEVFLKSPDENQDVEAVLEAVRDTGRRFDRSGKQAGQHSA